MPRWTPEARAKQAALIKEWQPWKQSTGARTTLGKMNSSENWIYRTKHESKKTMRSIFKEAKRLLKRH